MAVFFIHTSKILVTLKCVCSSQDRGTSCDTIFLPIPSQLNVLQNTFSKDELKFINSF